MTELQDQMNLISLSWNDFSASDILFVLDSSWGKWSWFRQILSRDFIFNIRTVHEFIRWTCCMSGVSNDLYFYWTINRYHCFRKLKKYRIYMSDIRCCLSAMGRCSHYGEYEDKEDDGLDLLEQGRPCKQDSCTL